MGRTKRKASPTNSQQDFSAKIPATMEYYQNREITNAIANIPNVNANIPDDSGFPDIAHLLSQASQDAAFHLAPRCNQDDFYAGPEARVIDRNLWIRRYKDPSTLTHEVHWMRENNRHDGTMASPPSRQRVSISIIVHYYDSAKKLYYDLLDDGQDFIPTSFPHQHSRFYSNFLSPPTLKILFQLLVPTNFQDFIPTSCPHQHSRFYSNFLSPPTLKILFQLLVPTNTQDFIPTSCLHQHSFMSRSQNEY
jgi:hypothetical protein